MRRKKKEKRFKKKVLTTTWSGSVDFSDESEPKEERTNICFITKSDLEEVVDNLNSYSFFELQETFYSLLDEYKCISIKNMSLQKQEILTHDHNKTKKELEKTSNEKTLFF